MREFCQRRVNFNIQLSLQNDLQDVKFPCHVNKCGLKVT